MEMNKALRAMLDSVGMGLPDLTMPDFSGLSTAQTAQRLRKSFFRASRAVERDVPDLADVSAMTVDGAEGALPARLYTPLGAGIGPGPGILFYHGGGFVLGDLESHDMICRRLADASRCRVLSVDYRLAPENKFPAAHKDAEASWQWAVERADVLKMDPERMAVAGDSAGGNLAAFVCQEMARTEGPLPAFQLLLYPLMQFVDIRTKKMTFQEGGFFISPNMFDYFRNAYLEREVDRTDKRVSPLFAPDDDFAGLPPAYIMLCGWDPLRDEGKVYARKLEAHGVPVTISEHLSMVHGFLNLTSVSKVARDAIRESGEFVGRTLGARE